MAFHERERERERERAENFMNHGEGKRKGRNVMAEEKEGRENRSLKGRRRKRR